METAIERKRRLARIDDAKQRVSQRIQNETEEESETRREDAR